MNGLRLLGGGLGIDRKDLPVLRIRSPENLVNLDGQKSHHTCDQKNSQDAGKVYQYPGKALPVEARRRAASGSRQAFFFRREFILSFDRGGPKTERTFLGLRSFQLEFFPAVVAQKGVGHRTHYDFISGKFQRILEATERWMAESHRLGPEVNRFLHKRHQRGKRSGGSSFFHHGRVAIAAYFRKLLP